MHAHVKLLTATLAAALALCIATGTATASRSLSIEGGVVEPNGGVKLTLTGSITFENNFGGFLNCAVTLMKTVSRAIPKIEGVLLGRVTRVDIGGPERCSAMLRVVNVTEPELWRIIYRTFLGELPEITGLLFLLINTRFLLEYVFISRVKCLYENGRLPETIGILARVERRTIRELRTLSERPEQDAADLITQLSGSGACPLKQAFRMLFAPTEVVRIVLL